MKLKPPCKVRVEGMTGTYQLRAVSAPNPYLKAKGWKGFVAHIQNRNGSTVVEYNRLKPIVVKRYEGHHSMVKRSRNGIEPVELLYEERNCLFCGRKYKALGKLRNDRWFRIDWICDRCKNTEVYKSPGF